VWGKLLSMAVMLGGVSLFIGLIQSILRPHKVTFPATAAACAGTIPTPSTARPAEVLNIPNDGV
jgi:voltage-gated potassium channel